MVKLLVVLLTAVAAFAANPSITGEAIDNVTHSSARLHWDSTPNTNRQALFDTKAWYDAHATFRYKTARHDDYAAAQYVNVSGLTPATAYSAAPYACDAEANCATGDVVEFTTSAEPSPHPALPVDPDLTGLITAYPSVDTTLNVAANCSDFQTQLTAAASATYTNQTVKVVIPAGTTCDPGSGNKYTLYPKTGSGWVIVQSGGTLPAEGTRLSPVTDETQLGVIQAHTTGGSLDFSSHTAHHYRFVGIKFIETSVASVNDVVSIIRDTLLSIDYAVIHDIVLDRCYLHGPGYPDRIKYGIVAGSGAYNIAILDSYMDNIDVWRAYQSGIVLSRLDAATNSYSSGMAYMGNIAVPVGAFSIALSGTGTGAHRIYVTRAGAVHVVHDVASGLTVTCTGCTSSYDAALTIPSDAFGLLNLDDANQGDITDAQFKTATGVSTGAVWMIQGFADIGVGEGAAGFLLGHLHKMVVRNNYLGATGITILAEQYTATSVDDIASDFEITQNTFASNATCFAYVAGDTNRICYRRNHLEFKAGFRLKVEGNTFTDAWIGIYGVNGAAIYIANRANGIPLYTGMSDITIRSNWVDNHPNCFHINGTESSYPQSKLTMRLLIENNFCMADAWSRVAYYATSYYTAMLGAQLNLVAGGEDYTVRHNTFYDVRGYQPHLIWLTDTWHEGLVVQDNIFIFHNDNSVGGIRMYLDYEGSADPAFASSSRGTTALNEGSRRMAEYPGAPAWTFDHNVIVAGCNDSSTCTDATSANLVDPDTQDDLYPSTNYWPAGATFGARKDAVGWTDRATNVFNLTTGSAYHNAGSDGADIGVNWPTLMLALGRGLPSTSIEGGVVLEGSVVIE
jgi:hypothetical protein